jgi:hypothetical protein
MGLASALRDFKVAMDCGKEASLVPCPAVNAIRDPGAIAIPAVMLPASRNLRREIMTPPRSTI